MSVLDTVDIKVTLLDKLRDDTVPHKRAILHYNVSVDISRLWLALLLPFLHHGQVCLRCIAKETFRLVVVKFVHFHILPS